MSGLVPVDVLPDSLMGGFLSGANVNRVMLRDWELAGEHYMHKSWQFPTCQAALKWHALAKAISESHGSDCLFYLGHVGSGRIEADILNGMCGSLTSDDLAVAMMLDNLEKELMRQANPG